MGSALLSRSLGQKREDREVAAPSPEGWKLRVRVSLGIAPAGGDGRRTESEQCWK
jgi:hypothetical protein